MGGGAAPDHLFHNPTEQAWASHPCNNSFLVGGFKPIENYQSNWIIFPGWSENKWYLKPSPSFTSTPLDTRLLLVAFAYKASCRSEPSPCIWDKASCQSGVESPVVPMMPAVVRDFGGGCQRLGHFFESGLKKKWSIGKLDKTFEEVQGFHVVLLFSLWKWTKIL